MDAISLVHNEAIILNGELWLHGSVVLSWDGVKRDTFTFSGWPQCCTALIRT